MVMNILQNEKFDHFHDYHPTGGIKLTPPKKTLQKFMRFLAKIKPRAENLKFAREARQKIFRVFGRIARGKREKGWSKRVQMSAKILAKPPKF